MIAVSEATMPGEGGIDTLYIMWFEAGGGTGPSHSN